MFPEIMRQGRIMPKFVRKYRRRVRWFWITVLLCHRPELFGLYEEAGVCLTFTGHAHGGQVRIPFVGGVIAPNQGFFPAYDSGMYQSGDSVMLVSRGVGDSIIPLRINNRRSLLVAELQSVT